MNDVPVGNPKWEYAILASGAAPNEKEFMRAVETFGLQGWEAFQVILVHNAGFVWHFKRRKSSIIQPKGGTKG